MQTEKLKNLSQTLELDKQESILFRIGPLRLVINHEENEWSLTYQWHHEEEIKQPDFCRGRQEDFADIKDNLHRYAFAGDTRKLNLSPRLADRSIVARPRAPLNLVAQQNVWLYISSPIWLAISIGEEKTLLKEIPCHRPSDTWFGQNTIEGEVAYATHTHARLSLEPDSFSRHRAITAVNLINDTDKHLLLERISIPMPSLNTYIDEQNYAWTSCVSLLKTADNGSTAIKIESEPPGQVEQAQLITPPRVEMQRNVFIKTIRALLG